MNNSKIEVYEQEQKFIYDQQLMLNSSAPITPNHLLNAVPIRLQRSRQHKQVSPNGLPIAYVGRPTKWGNPYKEEVWGREQALVNYRSFLETCIKTKSIKLEELKGKNLSCWCSLKEKCHADILLEYVEGRHCI